MLQLFEAFQCLSWSYPPFASWFEVGQGAPCIQSICHFRYNHLYNFHIIVIDIPPNGRLSFHSAETTLVALDIMYAVWSFHLSLESIITPSIWTEFFLVTVVPLSTRGGGGTSELDWGLGKWISINLESSNLELCLSDHLKPPSSFSMNSFRAATFCSGVPSWDVTVN